MFKKLIARIKAMIEKAKYEEKMNFAKRCLNQFKELQRDNFLNGNPNPNNVFVGYFDDAKFEPFFNTERFRFNIMGFSFVIHYEVITKHSESIIQFTTYEEVKQLDRLIGLEKYDPDRAPYVRIDDLYFFIDNNGRFRYPHETTSKPYKYETSDNFKADVIFNYLKILQSYIQAVEHKEFEKTLEYLAR